MPPVSDAKKTAENDLVELALCVADAAKGMLPWQLPQSVLGRLERALTHGHSEYAMLLSGDIRRTVRYLTSVLIPSLQRRGPSWVPAPLRRVFFHETTIDRRPDQNGSYDSFPAEAWFFINGILTDPGMASWNADYLARIFNRPFTIIQNATDGPIADLLECADEKAFGMNGESADVAFPEIHRALKDETKHRIVVIAHSQGTLISAVIVRLLALIYSPEGGEMSQARQAEELAALRRSGVTLDPDDFENLTTEELRRLEIYCFANCASEMRYVDPERRLPWIESFGNEHDLVARLGMLAPNLVREDIAIDGPAWIHRGAWGHLLNLHYLRHIDLAQGGSAHPGPVTATADPYEPLGGGASGDVPRLFAYINGGQPDD